MTITNYCSEIPKREKQKFNHFSLKTSQVTQGVAENIQWVIDADFMTVKLHYNTELGAVKDRKKTKLCSEPASPVHILNVLTIIMQSLNIKE